MGPKKNQKMSLGTFLQDDSYGSWADEMEDMPLPSTDAAQRGYGTQGPRRDFSSTTGMGGASFGGRDNYQPREQLPLPTQPPYTAHLANLSFDVTQADISDFFQGCEVTSIRIVEDKMDRKPKGFGYVEYGSLEGLKTALSLSGTSLAGRQVRISVADPPKDRPEASRDFSDWTRRGPLPDLPQNQRRVSERNFGGNRNLDNVSDAGSERGGSRRGFGGDSDGKVRDFSNWERRGPLSPTAVPDRSLGGAGRQPSKDGAFRRNSPSWGEGRSQDGSRPPKREYVDRPAAPREAREPREPREPTAAEMDNQWRAKMRPDATPTSPEPDVSIPSSPAPAAGPAAVAPAPTTRPKLNLQKRTVSEAQPTSSAANTDSKASPFGAARPVDTAAKEREVEEKRQLAIRQKKEAEEKAKAEKAEEKRLAREKAGAEQPEETVDNEKDDAEKQDEDKEGAEEEAVKSPKPKFEVLRREASNTNDMIDDTDDKEEESTPAPEQDKAVKPKEVIRNIPNKPNGSWRKSGGPKPPAQSETAALEEDGWSTVSKSKKQSSNRRGNAPRAIAS